ncbi:hypothetical protein L4C33_00655 [Vibrio makurazakiensis]|uniref:hypothetical protein n=1 Tax=Vibrio makurazakiensis TaxID=2910250 RepID=UPI003D0C069A
MSIVIEDMATWPAEIVEYLDKSHSSFLGWETSDENRVPPQEYDKAVYDFRRVLKPFHLIGYHCTKLTKDEIEEIRLNGMILQDLESLTKRIEQLKLAGVISGTVASALVERNQANDSNRARMLWFCFFKPYRDSYGIHRFFRSWGGEALYVNHEGLEVTGRVLKSIGVPCVIEAKVSIESLNEHYYPYSQMVRVYLSSKGYIADDGCELEGYSTLNIPAEQIIAVHEYPSDSFRELTHYDQWDSSIAL